MTAVLVEEGDTVTRNQELFVIMPGEGAPAVAAPAAAAAPTPTPTPTPAPAPAPAPAAATQGHRVPMIRFRFGHNAVAAAAGAAAAYSGGGSLPEYANHVDPAPAALRAEKWRNKNTELSEEEMEAVMVRNNPCPHREHPPGVLLLTPADCSLVQLGDWNLS